MKLKRLLAGLILNIGFILLNGCDEVFQYSPHEVRFSEEESNLNIKAIKRIQDQEVQDTLKFVIIGDSQRFYDETKDFVESINQHNDIQFVVLAGDISHYGLEKEFHWVHEELKKMRVPYVGVIGNHDLLANGATAYMQMFGAMNFSFEAHHSKIICINTNSREYGFNGKVPELSWLDSELKSDKNYRHKIIVSHVQPFDLDFDRNLEQGFARTLSSNGVKLSLHGHRHKTQSRMEYDDGVEYFCIGSMNKRQYGIITAWDGGYKIDVMGF